MDCIVEAYQTWSEEDCAAEPLLDWPYVCAMQLLMHPVDTAISEFLNFVGISSNADRAWVIEYGTDLLRFRNTHEWCRGDTASFVEQLQDAPTTLIAWLHRQLVDGRAVAVNRVDALPRAARAIKMEFLRQENKSILSIPIIQGNNLRGIIGFDTTQHYHRWTGAEVRAMFQAANLIAQAKYGNVDSQQVGFEEDPDTNHIVYLRTKGAVRGVAPNTIIGVRSAGNYSEIWLSDGSMLLDARPLGVWMSILPESNFLRIHRTAYVNALYVSDLDRTRPDKWSIKLRATEQPWPVSRLYRKALRERLGV